MNILVTGAKGMVGTALVANLKNIRDGKNRTRPGIHIEEIYEYDLDSTRSQLDEYCKKADFVFNLAGVNRPENPEDFMKGNFGFASDLLNNLKKYHNKAAIMLSSSVQATLAGRFGNSEYGRSKKAGEELFFAYGEETGAKVAVYRFANLMGHSRPKYNSAISTFCWAVANDEPFTVNDRSTELEVLYIDDLVEGMFDLLEGKEKHCEFDGVATLLTEHGRLHPEGDVWNHTMLVLDEAAKLRQQAKEPLGLMLAALCHDLGKKEAIQIENGRIRALGHEEAGIPLTQALVSRLTGERKLQSYVSNMVLLHMRPNLLAGQHSGPKSYRRLFDRSVCPEDLLLLSKADALGCSTGGDYGPTQQILAAALADFREVMTRPHDQGADLVQAGFAPGKDFAGALELAHKLRLAGVEKKAALAQSAAFLQRERTKN